MEFEWVPSNTRSTQKTKKSKKKSKPGLYKKKVWSTNLYPPHIWKKILLRFEQHMTAVQTGTAPTYGVSDHGDIRFFVYSEDIYVQGLLTSYDRSLGDWIAFIDKHKDTPFTMYNTIVKEFETHFYRNQRLRWNIRVWVAKVRRRIMDKRIIGEEDLCTTMPIPLEAQVAVYDTSSRNKYLFHTNTIINSFLSRFQYSSYGIAAPKPPNNPYTNIPWTIGQCIAIVGQIFRNQALHHRMTHTLIIGYRLACYNIDRFFIENERVLHIHAAVSLFKTMDNPETREIYNEVLDDIFETGEEIIGYKSIKRAIKWRELPPEIMARWDAIVLAFWLHSNYRIFILPYITYYDLDTAFHTLCDISYAWCRKRYGRHIVARQEGLTNTILNM